MNEQQRKAMELALEALESSPMSRKNKDGIDALREALAQQSNEQVEPVAWKLVPTEPTEEMLKAMDECSTEGYDERLYAGHAASVYMAAIDAATTPPQRKPLTDEQICSIGAEVHAILLFNEGQWGIEFARAIEAAHGIKEKNT